MVVEEPHPADGLEEAEAAAEDTSPGSTQRGKTVHGEAANAGHRVLAPDDAEVEAYLETALNAPSAERPAGDRPVEPDAVVVLDFGSQFAQLIARRVRELNVYSELLPHDTPWAEIERRAPKAIILSGGPCSVYDEDAPRPDPAVWRGDIPVLGICYGAQLMAHELGGDVLPAAKREYGPATVTITTDDGLFTGLDRDQPVWMSHGDSITRLPPGFRPTAQTDSSPFAGLVDVDRNLYGIQFHPEVVHTPRGRDVLRNFVVGIAGARQTWTPASFIDQTVAEIRRRVDDHAAATGSDGLVICALSGGVDSAVAAALVHRAVGDRLTCIYVDHGLMRKKESELLRETFAEHLGMRLVMVDARERFLRAARRRRGPRAEAADHRRRVHPGLRGRGGSPRPDRLPHPGHALPGRHRERDVGDEGRPEDQDPPQRRGPAGRSPVPADRAAAVPVQGRGPGGRHRARACRRRSCCASRSLVRASRSGSSARSPRNGSTRSARPTGSSSTRSRRAGLYRSLWQSFAILTPVRSVGVMGDGRTYANVVAVRAVTSEDGMTADWAKLPYDVLGKISSRIVNEVAGVNRVVYDISSKPPATIEWE